MKRNLYILYYIFMALPIPVSMVTCIGTLISGANMSAMGGEGIVGTIHRVIASLSMLFAGTYLIPYVFSLYRTKTVRKITFAFFLPILHIVVTIALICLWTWFDK